MQYQQRTAGTMRTPDRCFLAIFFSHSAPACTICAVFKITYCCRKRHGVLSYDRNRNSWGDWSSSVERERMRREAELQRQRLQELLQQQMQQRPAWQTFLLPAVGAGFFALVLGRSIFSTVCYCLLPVVSCKGGQDCEIGRLA